MWRFGWDNPSGLKVFVYKRLACVLFLRVKRVYFSNFRNERGFKVDGMVVGSVRRENIVGFLREYVFEVRAPGRNLLFWGLRCLRQFGGQRDLVEMFAIGVLLREVLTKRRIILRRIPL